MKFLCPSTTHHTGPFRFLDLPPELRIKIYQIICTSPEPLSLYANSTYGTFIPPPYPGPNPYSFPHALHLVSHQIYDEIRPLYFNLNTFWLVLNRNTSGIAYFLSPSFLDNRRQIRHLKIQIHRWGSKNYFKDEFAPTVEDMILNGSLRKLGVVLSENFADGFERKRSEKEEENWVIFKRLCNDPYLESVTLKKVFFGGDVIGAQPKQPEEKDISYLLKMT